MMYLLGKSYLSGSGKNSQIYFKTYFIDRDKIDP